MFDEGDAVEVVGGADYGIGDLEGKQGRVISFDGLWVVVDVGGQLERVLPSDLRRV